MLPNRPLSEWGKRLATLPVECRLVKDHSLCTIVSTAMEEVSAPCQPLLEWRIASHTATLHPRESSPA